MSNLLFKLSLLKNYIYSIVVLTNKLKDNETIFQEIYNNGSYSWRLNYESKLIECKNSKR